MTASRGRPPLLDPRKQSEICAILAVGCTRQVAAAYVGCAPATIRNTARRDVAFARRLQQAENQQEVALLAHLNTVSREGRDWRAAAWLLERKFPQRYAARKADDVPRQLVVELIDMLTAVVLEEVSDRKLRRRLRARLASVAQLGRTAPRARGKRR